MNVIETDGLTKRYSGAAAVDGLTMRVPKGAVYGFLGPNGAGKSTTMKMLLGLTRPSGGSFTVNGMSFPRDRRRILKQMGSLIESPAYYPNLTGEENLDVLRRLLGLPAETVGEALELVGLAKFGGVRAGKYSLGMKQRLGLAGALLGRPPIVILDEPTNGLDPEGIRQVRQLIRSLPRRYGCTVLVSSHLLSEMELTADTVGILNRGRLLYEGPLDGLRRRAAAEGRASDSLEEIFLDMIAGDDKRRGAGDVHLR